MRLAVLACLAAVLAASMPPIKAHADTQEEMRRLLAMERPAGFFSAALYPQMTLPPADEIETSDWQATQQAGFGNVVSHRDDGFALIRINRSFGLTIDQSSGRPYVQGLLFSDSDVELRASTYVHSEISGAQGHLSLHVPFRTSDDPD